MKCSQWGYEISYNGKTCPAFGFNPANNISISKRGKFWPNTTKITI